MKKLSLFFLALEHSGGDVSINGIRYRVVGPGFYPPGGMFKDVFGCYPNGNVRYSQPLSFRTLTRQFANITEKEIAHAGGIPLPMTVERAAILVNAIAARSERDGTTENPPKFDDTVIEVCKEQGADTRWWRVFDLAFHWWSDVLFWAENPDAFSPASMAAFAKEHKPCGCDSEESCDDCEEEVTKCPEKN